MENKMLTRSMPYVPGCRFLTPQYNPETGTLEELRKIQQKIRQRREAKEEMFHDVSFQYVPSKRQVPKYKAVELLKLLEVCDHSRARRI